MATNSEFCIWMEWKDQAARPISVSYHSSPGMAEVPLDSGLEPVLEICAAAAATDATLRSGPDPAGRYFNLAAAPVRLHSQVWGIFAIGNRLQGYEPKHIVRLEKVGQAALLRWEYLRQCEVLGVTAPRRMDVVMADLVHDLRQPLSTIEALAAYLEIVLPANETRAREHLQEIRLQVTLADRILLKTAWPEVSTPAQPDYTTGELGAAADGCFAFTNAASAAVTH